VHTGGQLVSLLFIPALCAATLMYVWFSREGTHPLWPGAGSFHWRLGYQAFVRSAIDTAPIILWLVLARPHTDMAGIVGAFCAILIVTATLSGILTVASGPDVSWAVGPLAIVALSDRGNSPKSATTAFLLLFSCIAACWIVPDSVVRWFRV
jgi:hypothetical protein